MVAVELDGRGAELCAVELSVTRRVHGSEVRVDVLQGVGHFGAGARRPDKRQRTEGYVVNGFSPAVPHHHRVLLHGGLSHLPGNRGARRANFHCHPGLDDHVRNDREDLHTRALGGRGNPRPIAFGEFHAQSGESPVGQIPEDGAAGDGIAGSEESLAEINALDAHQLPVHGERGGAAEVEDFLVCLGIQPHQVDFVAARPRAGGHLPGFAIFITCGRLRSSQGSAFEYGIAFAPVAEGDAHIQCRGRLRAWARDPQSDRLSNVIADVVGDRLEWGLRPCRSGDGPQHQSQPQQIQECARRAGDELAHSKVMPSDHDSPCSASSRGL